MLHHRPMPTKLTVGLRWLAGIGLVSFFCTASSAVDTASSAVDTASSAVDSESASALRDQYILLNEPLNKNAFQRPLVLLSTETAHGMRGDIYALMSFPFAAVS